MVEHLEIEQYGTSFAPEVGWVQCTQADNRGGPTCRRFLLAPAVGHAKQPQQCKCFIPSLDDPRLTWLLFDSPCRCLTPSRCQQRTTSTRCSASGRPRMSGAERHALRGRGVWSSTSQVRLLAGRRMRSQPLTPWWCARAGAAGGSTPVDAAWLGVHTAVADTRKCRPPSPPPASLPLPLPCSLQPQLSAACSQAWAADCGCGWPVHSSSGSPGSGTCGSRRAAASSGQAGSTWGRSSGSRAGPGSSTCASAGPGSSAGTGGVDSGAAGGAAAVIALAHLHDIARRLKHCSIAFVTFEHATTALAWMRIAESQGSAECCQHGIEAALTSVSCGVEATNSTKPGMPQHDRGPPANRPAL